MVVQAWPTGAETALLPANPDLAANCGMTGSFGHLLWYGGPTNLDLPKSHVQVF